jgi:hypothetical protein
MIRSSSFEWNRRTGGLRKEDDVNRITLRQYLILRNLRPGTKRGLEEHQPDTAFLAERVSCAHDSTFQLFRFKTREGRSVFLVAKGSESRLIAEKDWDFELANARDLISFLPAGPPVALDGRKRTAP